MNVKELKNILPDEDIPVFIINDSGYYEWYGAEILSHKAVVVKPKAVYILYANADMEVEDSVICPGELESIENHHNTLT